MLSGSTQPYLWSPMFNVFLIHATSIPIEVFSESSDWIENVNSLWTIKKKGEEKTCLHMFTLITVDRACVCVWKREGGGTGVRKKVYSA